MLFFCKVQCEDSESINNLIFKNCFFPNEKLSNDWLTIKYPITSLTLEENSLSSIEEKSFSQSIFKNLKSLSIIKTRISKLSKFIFNELGGLKSLTIRDNPIKEVEENLFENISESLETLVLDGSIKNSSIFINMMRGKQLSKIQLLSLQGNYLENLPENFLKNTPNILSLYMDCSNIKIIDENLFKSTRKIQQIFLNNNEIKTLPKNLFAGLIRQTPNLRVTMEKNPWLCDCKLSWIKNMIKIYPNFLTVLPECKSPDENIGLNFIEAEFCTSIDLENSSTTNSEFLPTQQIETTTLKNEKIESEISDYFPISCRDINKINSSNFYSNLISTWNIKLPMKKNNFFITELSNKSIMINFENSNTPGTLIWFKNDDKKKSLHIHCLKNFNDFILLNDFESNSLYTICLLENYGLFSPLNCRALSTSLPKNLQTWLNNSDKIIVWTLIIAFNIFFFIIGGVWGFFLVRKYPSLLKGSRKIVMLKKGKIRAMALPRGVEFDEEKKRVRIKQYSQRNYSTSVERRRKFDDDFEGYETVKYSGRNSGISASISSIVMNLRESNEPPPLPPYPRNSDLPILSPIVDYAIE